MTATRAEYVQSYARRVLPLGSTANREDPKELYHKCMLWRSECKEETL